MSLLELLSCALHVHTHNTSKGRIQISKNFQVRNRGNEIAITVKPSICIHREVSRSSNKETEGDVIKVTFLGSKLREMKNCDHYKTLNLFMPCTFPSGTMMAN